MGGRAPGWMKRRTIEFLDFSDLVDDVKTGGWPIFRDKLGGCTETAQAASRHVGGGKLMRMG